MFRIKKIAELTRLYLQMIIKEGDQVVDATAGNGFDTLYLAGIVGKSGHVYAFDIQSEALAITQKKLIATDLADRVTLINDGHEKLDLYVKVQVTAVIYNLGYRPGGCREKTTKQATTIKSLSKALLMLKNKGLAVLVIYPGHGEGKIEKDQLLKYCGRLSPREYNVLHLYLANQPNEPPELLVIQRNNFGITGDA